MSARARRVVSVTAVVLGGVYVAWLGFRVQTTGDYPTMFAAPMNALLGGHLGAFFSQLPTDGAGGSVLLRAPGALFGKLLDGSQLARFRFGALECALASGAVGLWLARDMRKAGAGLVARATVLALAVLTPALLDAIFFGHPEEPLGATLCLAAVLLAARDRPALAGASLGLAIINKPWGVFAVAPALLVAPGGRSEQLAVALVAAAVVAGWSLSAFLVAPHQFEHSLSSISVVAHPQELWWPLARLRAPDGVTPAYFLPSLITSHARELAVLLIVPLSVPLVRQRARRRDAPPSLEQCLALLALLMLLRCLLDPSNHIYYQVPFVLALVAWEAQARSVPAISLASAGSVWLVFHTVAGTGSLDAQYVAYMGATLPMLVLLGRRAFGAGAWVSSRSDDRHRSRRELPGGFATDS